MKLVSFINTAGLRRIGIVQQQWLVDLGHAAEKAGYLHFPADLDQFVWQSETFLSIAHELQDQIKRGDFLENAIELAHAQITSPIAKPNSCRDGYAFRQHVEAARRNRNVEMIPEFDQYPIFYFTNHNAIYGPGNIPCMADHFQQLDFELEVAVVIGKKGRNIRADDADEYIFGYTIMNDFSARVLQMEEMKLNLGPAKGKDFATSIGPILVTRDELSDYKQGPKAGHVGERYNLPMNARVNGQQVSMGNLSDMDWTFAEIIERCSYGVDIYPTDVIGSGTVGTGCFLELNGTAKRLDPNAKAQWLQVGDVVELIVAELGVLSNTMVRESDFSILAKKHELKA
jgi:fumarylacetoacetate (FAA) hydrolase